MQKLQSCEGTMLQSGDFSLYHVVTTFESSKVDIEKIIRGVSPFKKGAIV